MDENSIGRAVGVDPEHIFLVVVTAQFFGMATITAVLVVSI